MSSKQSLAKLLCLMQARAPGNSMFYRNAFAVTCHLFVEGKQKAARKFLSSLFDQLGWDGNKTYFNDLQSSMIDHAATYAKEINENAEISVLGP